MRTTAREMLPDSLLKMPWIGNNMYTQFGVNSAGQYGPTSTPSFSIGNYRSSKIHFDVSTWTCKVRQILSCMNLSQTLECKHQFLPDSHCNPLPLSLLQEDFIFYLLFSAENTSFFFLLTILTVHLQGPTTTIYLLLVFFFLNCRCLSIMDVPLKVNLHFSTVFYLLSSEKDIYIRHLM